MQLREQGSMNIHIVTRCAVFTCLALAVYVIESFIPPVVPIPGIKPGLANIVTLSAIYILGAREAFYVLLARIILGSICTGQAVSFIYSLAGGMACYFSTLVLRNLFGEKTLWALGVTGALFHNAAQLACAVVMLGSTSVVYYGIALGLASCVTGAFTGLCAQYAVNKYTEGKNSDYRL